MVDLLILLILLAQICSSLACIGQNPNPEKTQCDLAPNLDGCSIPGDLPYFFKEVFEPECNKHDICYKCGSSLGTTRKTCDTRFARNLRTRCETDDNISNVGFCKRTVRSYYLGVRIGGGPSYKKKQDAPIWCSKTWVNSCIA